MPQSYNINVIDHTLLANGISYVQRCITHSSNNSTVCDIAHSDIQYTSSPLEDQYIVTITVFDLTTPPDNNAVWSDVQQINLNVFGNSMSSSPAAIISIFDIQNMIQYVNRLYAILTVIVKKDVRSNDEDRIIINLHQEYNTFHYIDYTYKRKYDSFASCIGGSLIEKMQIEKTALKKSRYTSSISDLFNNPDTTPFLAVQDKIFVHNHTSNISDAYVKNVNNSFSGIKASSFTDRDFTYALDEIDSSSIAFRPPSLFTEYKPQDTSNRVIHVWHSNYMSFTRHGVHKIYDYSDTPPGASVLTNTLYHTSDLYDLQGFLLYYNGLDYNYITPYIAIRMEIETTNGEDNLVLKLLVKNQYNDFGEHICRIMNISSSNADHNYEIYIWPLDYDKIIVTGPKKEIDIQYLDQDNRVGITIDWSRMNNQALLVIAQYDNITIHNLPDILSPALPCIISGYFNLSTGGNLTGCRKFNVTDFGGNQTLEPISNFIFPFYKLLKHRHTNNNQVLYPRYSLYYKKLIQ